MGAIRELFQHALTSSTSKRLHDLSERLRMLTQRPQATLLIIIDQVRGGVVSARCGRAIAQFCVLLRMMLARHEYRMLVLGTLRSDFLGEWQNREPAYQIPYEPFHLDPAALDFQAVIAEPARFAGIELEGGLIEEMVKDTGTKEALPLLAFTLRELWERYGEEKQFTLSQYNDLGRLKAQWRGQYNKYGLASLLMKSAICVGHFWRWCRLRGRDAISAGQRTGEPTRLFITCSKSW